MAFLVTIGAWREKTKEDVKKEYDRINVVFHGLRQYAKNTYNKTRIELGIEMKERWKAKRDKENEDQGKNEREDPKRREGFLPSPRTNPVPNAAGLSHSRKEQSSPPDLSQHEALAGMQLPEQDKEADKDNDNELYKQLPIPEQEMLDLLFDLERVLVKVETHIELRHWKLAALVLDQSVNVIYQADVLWKKIREEKGEKDDIGERHDPGEGSGVTPIGTTGALDRRPERDTSPGEDISPGPNSSPEPEVEDVPEPEQLAKTESTAHAQIQPTASIELKHTTLSDRMPLGKETGKEKEKDAESNIQAKENDKDKSISFADCPSPTPSSSSVTSGAKGTNGYGSEPRLSQISDFDAFEEQQATLAAAEGNVLVPRLEELYIMDERTSRKACKWWKEFRDNRPWMRTLYLTLEVPDYSNLAFCWAIFMALMLALFILQIILESFYDLAKQDSWELAFFVMDSVSSIVFTIDIVVRFCLCPSHCEFLKGWMNWFDFLSVVPYYLSLGIKSSGTDALQVIRVLRLIRLVRLFRLGKMSTTLFMLGEAVKSASQGIFFLLFLLFIEMLFFGTLLYSAETAFCEIQDGLWVYTGGTAYPDSVGTVSVFQNVLDGMWWCITTLTTVGYGDTFPVTYLGRFFGSITMITALITIAFPITLIGDAFGQVSEKLKEARHAAELHKARMKEQAKNRSVGKTMSFISQHRAKAIISRQRSFRASADISSLGPSSVRPSVETSQALATQDSTSNSGSQHLLVPQSSISSNSDLGLVAKSPQGRPIGLDTNVVPGVPPGVPRSITRGALSTDPASSLREALEQLIQQAEDEIHRAQARREVLRNQLIALKQVGGSTEPPTATDT